MKKGILSSALLGGLMLASLAMSSLFLGCETSGNTEGLAVTPSAVTLSGSSNSVVLTVGGSTSNDNGGLRTLSLPLEWSVANPGLGQIVSQGGYSAAYTRYAVAGVNTVKVKDQYGAEGLASVNQQ